MSERTPPKKPTLKPDQPRPPAMTPEFKQAEWAKAEAGAAVKKPAIPGWMWGVLIAVLVAVAAGIVILRPDSR